ncbi:MAG: hypothetical protein ABI877_18865, partial [Gemmatimonadaceae bacterium]
LCAIAGIAALAACGPSEQDLSIRQWTEDMAFRINSDPVPPRAREKVVYKVQVRDSKTGEPVEGGEGRIFASSRDGASAWDSLIKGEELGTYYATVKYITAGEWAVALQFRRDSTRKLERMDWMQQVFAARDEIP